MTPPWHPGHGPDGLWAEARAAARERLMQRPGGMRAAASDDGARLVFRLDAAVLAADEAAEVVAVLEENGMRCRVECACEGYAACAAALARARADGRSVALCPAPVCWHVALVDEALLGHDRDKVISDGAAATARPNPSAAPRMLCARRWAEALARARSFGAAAPVLEWCGLRADAAERAFGRVQPYEWQRRALALPRVLDGGASLVFCAPTGAGKSLVAETLLLRALLERRRSALLVLPYVALCGEKASRMARAMAGSGVPVRKLYGGEGFPVLPRKALGLVVCTYEKAAWLVGRLVAAGRMAELGCVVVDEVHMVAEGDRGVLLELLLTKLVLLSSSAAAAAAADSAGPGPGTPPFEDAPADAAAAARPTASGGGGRCALQLVAMSATLNNPERLAAWLRAQLFVTDFRPVALARAVAHRGEVRPVASSTPWSGAMWLGAGGPTEHLVALVRETVADGGSVLVFCGTRHDAEATARALAERVRVPCDNDARRTALADRICSLLAPLQTNAAAMAAAAAATTVPSAARLARAGVAFHHGGLSPDMRAAVEGAYRAGLLRVLVATSTLAHGVNLPARRVIVRGTSRGRAHLDAATFTQMAGRAGRAGLDARGEAVILAETEAQARAAQALLDAGPPPLASRLAGALDALALDAVASGLARTAADMERVARATLAAALAESDFQQLAARFTAALRRMRDDGLLASHAASAGRDLAAARRGLVLSEVRASGG